MLVALPSAVGALPAAGSELSAGQLLAKIQQSHRVGYSGYAESFGGLSLPVTSQFSSLSNLFGDRTQLRVWWRSDRDWRVDSIGFAGETDLHGQEQGFWRWDYEANDASFTVQPIEPEVRLPIDADLLPPQLADRLASEATPAEISRLPSARVAGISAPGLRIRPNEVASTDRPRRHLGRPEHRVAAAGRPRPPSRHTPARCRPASWTYTSRRRRPAAPRSRCHRAPACTAAPTLTWPPGSISSAAARHRPRWPASPATRSLPGLGSVGVFGRGVTEFVVVPLPRRIAYSLHRQLAPAAADSAGAGAKPATAAPADVALSAGPLNLLLTSFAAPGGPWLLIGTVTADTLAAAAKQLPASAAADDQTHQLTKRFGSLTAVDAVDLDVQAGDIYGFLGANGSGKTTTVRMLLGLVLATSGRIELLGQPMPKAAALGARPGRRAGRGPGRLRAPVRSGQPDAARCQR